MTPPRRFPRPGALPRPTGRTQTIAALLARAAAEGRPVPTDAEIAVVLAMSVVRVARHRGMIGR